MARARVEAAASTRIRWRLPMHSASKCRPMRHPIESASAIRFLTHRQLPDRNDFFGAERSAAQCGIRIASALALAALLAACAQPARVASRPPAAGPGACSWFGDARGETLFFGESGFWSAHRGAGDDPTADLRTAAPQVVGRFDLARERMLPPLATALPLARSGTWDVLAHPNGRVYFTSFYDASGAIDPERGTALRFDAAGTGLNELALLPDGRIAATRYGASDGRDGSIVVLSEDGAVLAEHALAPERGATVAAKSLAFDPLRSAIWVNTDVIPAGGGKSRHDARVHDLASGRETARFAEPELHFPAFAPDGRGFFAWLAGTRLVLQITEAGEASGPEAGRVLLLDDAFPAGVDFVQDVRVQRDGRVVATRWSGVVHVVAPDDTVRSVQLPRPDGALTYTAIATGDRVCATQCAGVRVACASLR